MLTDAEREQMLDRMVQRREAEIEAECERELSARWGQHES